MKSLVFLPFLALTITACSSGNDSKGKNELCDKKWAPGVITELPGAQEKVDTSDSAKSLKMKAGEYVTPSIRLFYFDKSSDIRLDLNIAPGKIDPKTGNTSFSINCVGGKGLRSNMDTLSIKIPFVAKMKVDGAGSGTITKNELSIDLNSKTNRSFIHVTTAGISEKSDSLKDTYPKDADKKHILYKVNDDVYESRIQLMSQGRKDTKGDQRSLDVRAYISYTKAVVVEE